MISSVIEECQSNIGKLEKHLMIKAFPYEDKNRPDYIQLKREYREGIYKYAGIAIFMFGNKESDAGTILADGVYEEYKNCIRIWSLHNSYRIYWLYGKENMG